MPATQDDTYIASACTMQAQGKVSASSLTDYTVLDMRFHSCYLLSEIPQLHESTHSPQLCLFINNLRKTCRMLGAVDCRSAKQTPNAPICLLNNVKNRENMRTHTLLIPLIPDHTAANPQAF